MKTYWVALDGAEWSPSRSSRFTPSIIKVNKLSMKK